MAQCRQRASFSQISEEHGGPLPFAACASGGRDPTSPPLGIFLAPLGNGKIKLEFINAKNGIQQIGSEVWTASGQSADERKFCQKILKSMADHCHPQPLGGETEEAHRLGFFVGGLGGRQMKFESINAENGIQQINSEVLPQADLRYFQNAHRRVNRELRTITPSTRPLTSQAVSISESKISLSQVMRIVAIPSHEVQCSKRARKT